MLHANDGGGISTAGWQPRSEPGLTRTPLSLSRKTSSAFSRPIRVLLLLMALGLLGFAIVGSLDSALSTVDDSAIYVSLARALAQHEGYRSIYLADAPPHTKYPPVLPVLLSPIGGSVVAMKL